MPTSLAAARRFLVPPTMTDSNADGITIIESGLAVWKMVVGRAARMTVETALGEEMSQA